MLYKMGKKVMVVISLVLICSSTIIFAAHNDTEKEASITVHRLSDGFMTPYISNSELHPSDNPKMGNSVPGIHFVLFDFNIPQGEALVEGNYQVDIIKKKAQITTNTGVLEGTIGDRISVEKISDIDGNLTFSKLASGNYMIIEIDDQRQSEAIGIAVTVPKQDNTEKKPYQVHVYPPNRKWQPMKVFNYPLQTYQVGDTARFHLQMQMVGNPSTKMYDLTNIGESGEVVIQDALSSGLQFMNSTLQGTNERKDSIELRNGQDYIIRSQKGSEETMLYWQFTKIGMDKIIHKKMNSIEIEIVTKVMVANTFMANWARSYIKSPGEKEDDLVKTEPMPIATVNLSVYNQRKDHPVAGVVYAISADPQGTQYLMSNGQVKEIKNRNEALDNQNIVKGTSDAKGKVIFSGLHYDASKGSRYYLVQLKAPSPYRKKRYVVPVQYNVDRQDFNITENVVIDMRTKQDLDIHNAFSVYTQALLMYASVLAPCVVIIHILTKKNKIKFW